MPFGQIIIKKFKIDPFIDLFKVGHPPSVKSECVDFKDGLVYNMKAYVNFQTNNAFHYEELIYNDQKKSRQRKLRP